MSTHSTRLKHINYLAEYHTHINLAGEDNQALDNPLLSGPSHISCIPESNDDDEMMISELWTPIIRDNLVIYEEEEEGDPLESLLQALSSQDSISCELPRFAAGTSSELPDDVQEDDEEDKDEVLAWAKAIGAPNVPALNTLKKVQASIEGMIGDPTEKVVSGSGTIFYINNIAQAIAKDFSNPITRFAMTEYPQDGQKCMSELRNGRKWLVDLPRELLTATAHVNNKLYFVGELLMCRDGGPPIDILFALGHMVQETTDGFVAGEMAVIPTSNFKETFEDLRDAGYLACGFSECSKSYEAQMPHPQREFANGHMIYGVPLIIFLDDVSGNISKQWNKHHAIYMSNALLPRKMIEKEFCTRFVTSSPHASPMELVKALKDSIGQVPSSSV
ncbi:hypothetical protein PQX77_006549 [Marasmius sp. AFHP31]|nr:hypothetical protein PQX77_006549 [Marasmius sp. AFHP31]